VYVGSQPGVRSHVPDVYRLKDDCNLVRKNTMMVLTHLILNDMIKIRGQISAMALCLEDINSTIMELAQVFFYELSQKVGFVVSHTPPTCPV
jgi:condensin complex subunit 1